MIGDPSGRTDTYVKRDKILAKAEFVYFPFSQITWLGNGAEY